MRRGIDGSTERPDKSGGENRRPSKSIPALTVVWHPDLDRIGEVCPLPDLSVGEPRIVSRLTPLFSQPGAGATGRPLEDSHLSRTTPAVAIARNDRGLFELHPGSPGVLAEAHGAPLTELTTVMPAEVDRGLILILARQIVLCLHRVHVPVQRGAPMGLVGGSDAMERVRRGVRRVAGNDVPVLVRGETGTGKELIARALVQASARAERPFVAINMAAIPASTAAAELFGHERGAFTGAAGPRRGLFGEAAGGTLFLDEIGLTPPDVQSLLLRALETGEVLPLGASRPRKANVRVIAATDADLEDAIAARSFSAPLFQRLAGFQIELPPLRQRREDFGSLLLHFLRAELSGPGAIDRLRDPGVDGPWLSATQVAHLATGTWPGNVRALRNAARQLAISGQDEPRALIDEGVERLMDGRRGPGQRSTGATPWPEPTPTTAAEISPDALFEALRRNRWSPSATAADLRIPRTTVHGLMDRHPQIRKANTIPEAELRREFRECRGDLNLMIDRLRVSRRGLQLRLAQIFQGVGRSPALASRGPNGNVERDE